MLRALRLAALLFASAFGSDSPTLHVITYATLESAHMKAVMMLHSAGAHGLYPTILGVGEVGSWPEGLWQKIPFVLDFITEHTADEDVVLFVDAYDVLFTGPHTPNGTEYKRGILESFDAIGADIVFNAERVCAYGPVLSPKLCPVFDAEAALRVDQKGASVFKYLNSGAWIGKARALKTFFEFPIAPALRASKTGTGDQMWYADSFVNLLTPTASADAPVSVSLDYDRSVLALLRPRTRWRRARRTACHR
jgi:hypothetical protein